MSSVRIRIDMDPSIERRLKALAQLLEGAPDVVRQCLLDRISRLFAGGGYLDARPAFRAGEHVLVVELLAFACDELDAIAACATQRSDVCHGCPSRKVM